MNENNPWLEITKQEKQYPARPGLNGTVMNLVFSEEFRPKVWTTLCIETALKSYPQTPKESYKLTKEDLDTARLIVTYFKEYDELSFSDQIVEEFGFTEEQAENIYYELADYTEIGEDEIRMLAEFCYEEGYWN